MSVSPLARTGVYVVWKREEGDGNVGDTDHTVRKNISEVGERKVPVESIDRGTQEDLRIFVLIRET